MTSSLAKARWTLSSKGEFLWESDRGSTWWPAGEGPTLGLASQSLSDMRTLATRALATDGRMTSAPPLGRLLGHRRWACAFRLTPPAGVELRPWAQEISTLVGYPAVDGDPSLPAALLVITLAQAGGQQLAFKSAWTYVAARIDGIGLSSAHCLVIGAK